MIASYFVSMCVTPVACRYFLGHAEHGRLRQARRGASSIASPTATRERCARVLPFRWTIIGASRRRSSSRAAGRRRACRARSSRRSTSRWTRSTCASRRASRSRTRRSRSTRWARRSATELPEGTVEMVVANVGIAAERAQRACRAPTSGPHTGFLRLAFVDPEKRKLSQREIADAGARDPDARASRASRSCSARAASSPASSPTATPRRSSSRCAATTSTSSTSRRSAIAEVARTVPGVRDVRASLQTRLPRDPRRHRSREGRARRRHARATRRRRRSTRRSATSTRRASGSTPHNGQSYYVVTYYDGAQVARHERARAAARARGRDGQAGTARRVRRHPSRPSGPIADRAQPPRSAPRTCSCRPKGATSAAPPTTSRRRSQAIRAPATSTYDFVGQVELMRTTFSGLGLALGLAVMVVFMIMASQFKSLRLPFVMLFTIPVSLVGHRARAHGRRAGLLDHRADGHPHGHRHRRVERHPARRRREPPLQRGRRRRSTRSSPRRARGSCRSR